MQRLQWLQLDGSLRNPNIDHRPVMPSSAPSGHSARHQKRVTRRFIASSARKATPTNTLDQ